MQHTIWNNSTILLTSWSSAVLHLERNWVPCTRCLNRRVLTPLPPMKMNYNRCKPRPVNGTLFWHSSWELTTPIMDDSCKTYKDDFTQGVDHYPRTRTKAFNIPANYKEDEQNYMWVVWSNDGIAFTTLDNNNTHHNTNEDNVTHIDDPSTTSNLTTSTNPQQHGSTMVTTGGGCGCSCNACGSTWHGRSEGCTIACFRYSEPDTMPLHAYTPLRRPNGIWQWPNQLDLMRTVKQPNKCLCLGPSVEHKQTSAPPINFWYLPMGLHKPTMALIYQKNGSYLTANPLSPSSVTINTSGTSINPTGGCISIVMQGSQGQALWATSVDMGQYGTTLMALQTSCHWLKYRNSFMSPMTVPNRMNLWFTSQMGPPSSSSNQRGAYTTSTLPLRAPL